MITPITRPLTRRLDLRNAAGPILTVAPSVTGTLAVGSTLTCAPGTWSGSPSITYQWLRNGAPIVGATASTRVLTADDNNALVQCAVTATEGGVAKTAVTIPLLVGAYYDFRTGAPAGLANVSASGGWAPNAAGTYSYFAPNTPKITDLGLSAEEEFNNRIANPTFTGASTSTPPTNTVTIAGSTWTLGTRDGLASLRQAAPSLLYGAGSHVFLFANQWAGGGAPDATWMPISGNSQRLYYAFGLLVHSSVNLGSINISVQGLRKTEANPAIYESVAGNAFISPATFATATRFRSVFEIGSVLTPVAERPFEFARVGIRLGPANTAINSQIDAEVWGVMFGAATPSMAGITNTLDGVTGSSAWLLAPTNAPGLRAADVSTLVIPDGADGDTIAVTIAGATVSLTRAQLFASTGSRTTLPLAVGALPAASVSISAAGLARGFRQTVTVTPA